MAIARRIAYLLLPAALLLAALAPTSSSAAFQPPPPTVAPVDAGPGPSGPAGAFLLPPPGCNASTTLKLTKAVGLNIPDGVNMVTSIIHVTTAGTFLWELVVGTDIAHPLNQDLDISLISPHGTVVTLSSNNGGLNANVFSGTVWYDRAASGIGPGVVTLASFVSGTVSSPLTPEEPLSSLNGEDPNGDWTLVVKDVNANGQAGRLNGWNLQLEALTQAPHAIVRSTSNSATTPIPDNGSPVIRPMFIYSLPGPLAAITLTTDIPHTYPGDLEISLVSPLGVTLTVSDQNGNTYDNSFGNGITGTIWYDAAGKVNPPGPVTDAPYATGKVQPALSPQEAFGELIGSHASGTWKFVVQDQAAVDVGTLHTVSLQVATYTCLPDLSFETDNVPSFPKLGGTKAGFAWDTANQGTLAHNVVTTATLSGPFPFAGALGGAGATCFGPAPGTLNAVAHCSLGNLGSTGQLGVQVTYTTPLVPHSAYISLAVTSTEPDLYLPDNFQKGELLAFAHSANGNPWDVADANTLTYADYGNAPSDSGSVIDGGQDAFDSFGQIHVRVYTAPNTAVDAIVDSLGLTYGPGAIWYTTVPQTLGNVTISRGLLAPAGQDWLRYVDTFTNNDPINPRTVWVAWGGNLGSDDATATQATSSGDATLTTADTWAVTQQDLASGYQPDAVLGYALRSTGDTSYQGPFDSALVITDTVWSSAGDDNLSNVYKLTLPPSATRRLVYFVYRGLAETAVSPVDCQYYGGCVTPAAGSQVTLARTVVAGLVAHPPLCDLSAAVWNTIANWPVIGTVCRYVFSPLLER